MKETPLETKARRVVERLREGGYEAYFAGGAVRDRLMEIPPEDVDIATSAPPGEVMNLFPRTFPVGVAFGVVLVRHEGHTFEVATFRSESGYFDGRRPTNVVFSSAEEDVKRRDFTINGMLYDPLTKEVVDFVGGREDLKNKIIKAIGNPRDRFAEDHLRLIRAVRFASRLDFSIHKDTWEALRMLGPSISSVSPERFKDEFLKILTGPRSRTAVERLDETGMLRQWIPEVTNLQNVVQPPNYHPEGDVWNHTLKCLEMMEQVHGEQSPPSEALALSVLLHDTGKAIVTRINGNGRPTAHGHVRESKAIADTICARLKTSKALKTKVTAIVGDHDKPALAPRMKLSKLKRLLREPHFPELLELHRIDRMAGSNDLSGWTFLKDAMEKHKGESMEPEPLLTGKDLADMGYSPGPEFGRVLRIIEDAQLDEKIKSREEAAALARKTLGAPAHSSETVSRKPDP